MKKIITMALVLVMALSLAAPALAYTTNEAPAQGASPYTVDMYLVEYYSSDILSGWIGAPPTDRGYAKNEVIAGIGALNVPANYDVWADGYRGVRFMPKNVTLDVVDNMNAARLYQLNHTVPSVTGTTGTVPDQWNVAKGPGPLTAREFELAAANFTVPTIWHRNADNGNLTHDIDRYWANVAINDWVIPTNGSAKTYRFLVFGKVTDDDAKLTFSLTRQEVFSGFGLPAGGWNVQYTAAGAGILPGLATGSFGINNAVAKIATGLLVLNEELLVARVEPTSVGDNRYYVMINPEDAGFAFRTKGLAPEKVIFVIDTASRGRTSSLYMLPNGAGGDIYRVHVEPSTQELVFIRLTSNNNWYEQVKFGSKDYAPLRAFYDQWFEGALGFTAFNEGNLLNASDWHALAAAAWDVTETVDIEPWTPYVSVPENIVTDPPKTGDVSVMGFVLIALAAAAAVVVKKVRA